MEKGQRQQSRTKRRATVDEIGRPKAPWGTRHTFTLMCFLSYALCFSIRVDLAVAIVAMVDTNVLNNGTSLSPCHKPDAEFKGTDYDSGHGFSWSAKEQGLLLSGFSIGYVFTQLLGGYLSERFGGKWVLGISTFGCGVLSMLIPIMAKVGRDNPLPVFAVRVLQGVFQGPALPATYSMAAKWLPRPEKTRLMAVISAGGQLGPVGGMLLSGSLTNAFGWEVIFYVLGGLIVVWFVSWTILGFKDPESHPRISEDEKLYIVANTGSSKIRRKNTSPPARVPAPYLKMLTSRPFWALQAAVCGYAWVAYIMLTLTPSYLHNIQNVSYSIVGYLSALPYLVSFILIFPISYSADRVVQIELMSIRMQRKLYNTIGCGGAALGLTLVALTKCDTVLAVSSLCMVMALLAFNVPGCFLAITDLAPNHTGSLLGVLNTVSNTMGFLAPIVSAVIVDGNQTFLGWMGVYLLAASVVGLGGLAFLFCGSTRVQEWN